MSPDSAYPLSPDDLGGSRTSRQHDIARARRARERAVRGTHEAPGATPRRTPVLRPPRSRKYRFGVVILTQGKRRGELCRAVDSVLAQRGVELDVVCVGNGWKPTGLPDGVKTLELPENIGIPAGRNEGVPHVSGEFIFFLDDDAWLSDDTTLMKMAQLMRTKPGIGLIQPRVLDPDAATAPRRWIPRLYKRSAAHSSNVFSVWEGAVCLQRAAFDKAGGWPAPFWYAHEGIELAWRIWDAGYQVWYMGDVSVAHPVIDQRRHDEYFYMNARNRVWLARRNLPWPIGLAYVGSWTVMQTLAWSGKPDRLRPWFEGWRDGWKDDPWAEGEARTKLTGMGVMRMAMHGRPPIV
ncbi:glycosyltransferase family 2 protein [Brevibacterium pityocampae]|uniref:Glycosyltransferase n=1 Tax=Brevibacterium pityocampae TaxID=506594 RepID=A0ABP8JK55_9MICO